MANYRKSFLVAFRKEVPFIPFFSSFFRTTPRDIVNAKSVAIDIKRGGRKVAPVISAITGKGGKIRSSIYTNKEFEPPTVSLSADVAPDDLLEKMFGMTEYDSADQSFIFQLLDKLVELGVEINDQFMRHIELQASQIFQTGTLTLKDENGNDAYTIDFKPKASHFPTVSTSWATHASATPDADLYALYLQIKKDAKVNIENIVFGASAYDNYIANDDVKTKFDLRRLESGTFNPQQINPDAHYLGDILIGGGIRVAAWKYDGLYENSSGTIVPFVDDNNVIMLPNVGAMNVDFRRVWCKVPTIKGVDPRFAALVPSELRTDQSRYTTIAGVSEGDNFEMELKARPLNIPVSIDAFGCLDTIP